MVTTDIIIDFFWIGFFVLVLARIALGCYRLILRYFWPDVWDECARRHIAGYDGQGGLSVQEVLDRERVEQGRAPVSPPPGNRVRYRVVRREPMIHALASEAYFEFGYRPRDEANELITRKFMRDLLADERDLRARDAAEMIDVALGLSFLPSLQLKRVRAIETSRRYGRRASPMESWWSGWFSFLGWLLFGSQPL